MNKLIFYVSDVTAAYVLMCFKNDISCLQKESLPFVNPVIGDMKNFYWSPIKVNDIRWNFERFLITGDGIPFKRYNNIIKLKIIKKKKAWG